MLRSALCWGAVILLCVGCAKGVPKLDPRDATADQNTAGPDQQIPPAETSPFEDVKPLLDQLAPDLTPPDDVLTNDSIDAKPSDLAGPDGELSDADGSAPTDATSDLVGDVVLADAKLNDLLAPGDALDAQQQDQTQDGAVVDASDSAQDGAVVDASDSAQDGAVVDASDSATNDSGDTLDGTQADTGETTGCLTGTGTTKTLVGSAPAQNPGKLVGERICSATTVAADPDQGNWYRFVLGQTTQIHVTATTTPTDCAVMYAYADSGGAPSGNIQSGSLEGIFSSDGSTGTVTESHDLTAGTYYFQVVIYQACDFKTLKTGGYDLNLRAGCTNQLPNGNSFCAAIHPGGAPFCVADRCVECTTSAHCPAYAPLCLADNSCGECTSGAQCTNSSYGTACATSVGLCACAINGQCTNSHRGSQCITAQSTCGCTGSADCVNSPRGASCIIPQGASSGVCGCKIPSDCVGKGSGTKCDPLFSICSCFNDTFTDGDNARCPGSLGNLCLKGQQSNEAIYECGCVGDGNCSSGTCTSEPSYFSGQFDLCL